MIRFILRRLAIIPPALLVVHFLGFSYAHLVRPLRAFRNPFLAAVTQPEPLIPTYSAYIRGVLHGDFGIMPGATMGKFLVSALLEAGLASGGLLLLALVLSVIVGLYLGLRAVSSDPPNITRWLTSLSTLGMATPTFFLGALYFAAWFLYAKWTPHGVVLPLPFSGYGWDTHLIVPTLVLMARPTVQIAQLTSGLLVEELGKQYVVASRSVGQTWRRIRWRSALRNIFAPIFMVIAGSVRLLVGELIVVEWLFGWPGLGRLLAQTLIPSGVAYARGVVERVLFLDPPVVAAVVMLFAALFLFTDLLFSVLARLYDPRLGV
ncbi:MAG: ABC transporter permease [Chloroflexota bacterium]